ncbi:MAG TPA: helix-hairpin-helix domain-containing protein [Patescibacteria group bacterium]|nr:helix-hairpin-helix domain-containing protein [Patescibacteria group bacterium]
MRWVALAMVSMVGVIATLTTPEARQESGRSRAAVGENDTLRTPAPKVDLNAASMRELQALPGFGAELAERVVRHRPYHKLDELIARKVLGRKEFARIKERIRVNSAADRKSSP